MASAAAALTAAGVAIPASAAQAAITGYRVTGTGGIGLKVRTDPNNSNAGTVANLADGTAFTAECAVRGRNISGNSVWHRISAPAGGWISDYYTTTPGFNQYIPGEPDCNSAPQPSPSGSGSWVGLAGKCVDVRGGQSGNGTPVQLYACNGTAAQKWTWTNSTLRTFGKCLDAAGGGRNNGTRIQLYDCNGTGAQTWQTVGNALRNPQSGRCLDVPGANPANGNQLQLYDCNGTAAQKWTLTNSPQPAPSPGRAHGRTEATNTADAGQCTWGAKDKFRQATGVYPALYGNAKAWASSARSNGWTVVADAQARAIVVFQPGVQGANRTYGHVAWVDSVERRSDGLYVRITEMNGLAGAYQWNSQVLKDVVGMSYILAP